MKEDQDTTHSVENDESKIHEIWNIIFISGFLIIILSIVSGGYIINEYGSHEVERAYLGVQSQTNILGTASGFAVIIQGAVLGILMIGFSRMGRFINRIHNKLMEEE